MQLPGGGSIHIDAPRDKIDYANRQWNLAGQNAWAAWQDASAAEAAVEQARITLADLKRVQADPQSADAQVIAATNARDEAEATVEQARAALAAVRAGPSASQIAAAESAVEQARAARDARAAQLEQTTILAPARGLISARYRSPGEVIGPGQPVLTIQDADHLQLTIYVPASHLGAFQAGDTLPVAVDSAPDRQFSATVLTISDEPEFTLQQAQNVAERAGRVYAVALRLNENDPLLRPGLPAHVLLTIRH